MRRPKGPAPKRDRYILGWVGRTRWVWWWSRWRGASFPRMVPSCWFDECPECQASVRELWSMKKPSITLVEGASALVRVEPPILLRKLPHVVEVLCQPVWSDSEPKGESALMIFRKGHDWRAILKVEVPPLMLSAPGRDLDDVLANLEGLLKADDVPWQQDANPLGRRSGKKRQAS